MRGNKMEKEATFNASRYQLCFKTEKNCVLPVNKGMSGRLISDEDSRSIDPC